jgi:hypothetical protein
MKQIKLAQRQVYSNHHVISIGLSGDLGYVSIQDNGLYPDGDSRMDRKNLGFDNMMIPLMSRNDLKELKVAIDEVLKNSK